MDAIRPPNTLGEVIDDVNDEMDGEVDPSQIARWCWRTLGVIHSDHLFSWMISNAQFVLTGDSDSYTAPYEMKKARRLWLLNDDYSANRQLMNGIDYTVKGLELEEIVQTGNVVVNESVTGRFGSKIVFSNSPATDVNMQIEYWRWPRRPIEQNDLIDVHPALIDIVVNGICYRAARHLKDLDQSNAYFADFRSGLQEAVDQDCLSFGGVDVPVPYQIDGTIVDWRQSQYNPYAQTTNDIFKLP